MCHDGNNAHEGENLYFYCCNAVRDEKRKNFERSKKKNEFHAWHYHHHHHHTTTSVRWFAREIESKIHDVWSDTTDLNFFKYSIGSRAWKWRMWYIRVLLLLVRRNRRLTCELLLCTSILSFCYCVFCLYHHATYARIADTLLIVFFFLSTSRPREIDDNDVSHTTTTGLVTNNVMWSTIETAHTEDRGDGTEQATHEQQVTLRTTRTSGIKINK